MTRGERVADHSTPKRTVLGSTNSVVCSSCKAGAAHDDVPIRVAQCRSDFADASAGAAFRLLHPTRMRCSTGACGGWFPQPAAAARGRFRHPRWSRVTSGLRDSPERAIEAGLIDDHEGQPLDKRPLPAPSDRLRAPNPPAALGRIATGKNRRSG